MTCVWEDKAFRTWGWIWLWCKIQRDATCRATCMVRQAPPLHYDCGFPLLAGNLPPFHHPHFPTVPFRIPQNCPFCFPSKYIHIIHGTHVHPWGIIASGDSLQSVCCGKSAWDSSDSFWAKRKLKVSREHITFCSPSQLELNWFQEMRLSKTKFEIWSE